MNGETSGLSERAPDASSRDSLLRSHHTRPRRRREKARAGERLIALAVALCLTACHGMNAPTLNDQQRAELDAHASLYHICVARMAARLDDGQSAVTRIADLAVGYCKPAADDVADYLDSIKLPQPAISQYIDQLLDTAARQSAIMLRDRRAAAWQQDRI